MTNDVLAVLKKLAEGEITSNELVGSIITIAKVAEEMMGGTSGALYS
jgi:dihydroxyacetone kinase